jgi:signal peptidase I
VRRRVLQGLSCMVAQRDAERTDPTRRRPVRWGAVALSLPLTPVAGYFAIGRTRRGLTLLLAGVGYLVVAVGAALLMVPPLMYAALAAALLHALVALVDVARLSRTGPLEATWGRGLAGGLGALALTAALALATHRYALGAARIWTAAMLPTLEIGDRFFFNRFTRNVRRGDVISFRYPPDPRLRYVQRVVALAGDSVAVEDGEFLINGQPPQSQRLGVAQRLDPVMGVHTVERWEETIEGRSYTIYRRAGPMAIWIGQEVPKGHVFVLGDNRDNSNDSRTWGTVPLELIEGRALFTWWSSTKSGIRWHRFNQPVQ